MNAILIKRIGCNSNSYSMLVVNGGKTQLEEKWEELKLSVKYVARRRLLNKTAVELNSMVVKKNKSSL